MKKQRKRPAKKTRNTNTATTAPAKATDRRSFLGIGLVGAVAVGGGGYLLTNMVMAGVAEQDLSRVGQGTPAIVQVHDPSCTMCQDLQRETRAALKAFDDDEITYLVANIKSDAGAAFATLHAVPHVTLVMFDGRGNRQAVLNGVRDRAELQAAFARLLGQ
ncbi:hypothetical protein [Yoonia sp. SS1-5]|uniref:Thioredoxin n=1 Tax=Yoonia rhodophyticola TaxID=3137370 RepID=A0AAN0M9I8_9RHOB